MAFHSYTNYQSSYKEDIALKKENLDTVEVVSKYFFTDQGKPFTFKGREYLYPLYNYNWPMLVVQSSRQAEKSTLIAKKSLSEVLWTPGEQLLYATAHNEHLKVFVRSKINAHFDMNPWMRSMYFDRKVTVDNIHEKRMLNGSVYYFRAIGKNPESARSATARKIYFDETQSIDSDSIPITAEITQSYSNSAYAFLGTPLTKQNILCLKYADSYQYEWIIRCSHCHADNPPLGKEHIDPKKPYLFCVYCGKKISVSNGRWVKQNPNGKYPGFRICRLMTPTCTWRTRAKDGVLDKLEDPNYPYFMFVNEVLGLSEGTGVLPISEEDLYKSCADYSWYDPNNVPDWLIGKETYGTIDWAWNTKEGGQSYTIYAIWLPERDHLRCIYAKRQIGLKFMSPEASLDDMCQAFIAFNTNIIMTDFGVGHKENIRLREKVGKNKLVVEALYTGSEKSPEYNEAERRYDIGKTASLDITFSALVRGYFIFPTKEESEMYLKDVLNVYTEYDPNTLRTKYDHAGTGPDDFLHLINYARLIAFFRQTRLSI